MRDAGRRSASPGAHMMRKKVFFALAVASMAAVTVVGFILENSVSPVVTRLFGTPVDKPSEAAVAATDDAARQLASEVEAQGVVLLANDGTLPLSAGVTGVNVFGWASVDWLGGGSGSGCVASVETDLISALNDAGIETNTELTAMYQDFRAAGKRPKTLSSRPEESSVLYEPSIEDRTCYTEELLRDAQAFSDTAIVVLQRYAGESNDMPLVQRKVSKQNGPVVADVRRTSLDLSTEEEALLAYVGATYESVIVVVNSANAMALGALESTPGIDAVLLVGYTGQYGAEELPKILWGEVCPSGRTADTYAYDLSTAPSYASASEHVGAYASAGGLYPADGTKNSNLASPEDYGQVSYVDYSEGVYVGYKWYETADAESPTGTVRATGAWSSTRLAMGSRTRRLAGRWSTRRHPAPSWAMVLRSPFASPTRVPWPDATWSSSTTARPTWRAASRRAPWCWGTTPRPGCLARGSQRTSRSP